MEDLERRRYAGLVARLVDRVELERVVEEAARLSTDTSDVHLRVLAGALGAAANAQAGGRYDPEAIVDARLPIVDAEPVAARLDDVLPGRGPIAARIDGFRAGIRIPADALESAAGRLLALLRDRAREDLPVPAGESVTVQVRRRTGEARLVRTESDGPRTVLFLHPAARWTPDRLLDIIVREAYPGRHLARLMNTDDCPRWEPSPITTVVRGREAIGREVLLADHELAHELDRIGRDLGLRWDGDLVCRVTRALDDRAPAIAQAALDSPNRDVLEDLVALGFDGERVPGRLDRWRDPPARAGELARAAGPPLVRRWLETTGQTTGLERLLSEPLTPTELRSEIGDGDG